MELRLNWVELDWVGLKGFGDLFGVGLVPEVHDRTCALKRMLYYDVHDSTGIVKWRVVNSPYGDFHQCELNLFVANK